MGSLVKVKNLIPPTRRPTSRLTRQWTHHQHTTDALVDTLPTRWSKYSLFRILLVFRILCPIGLWTLKGCEMGPTVLSPLSEKTRKSSHLQMSLQRQHFLLSHLILWRPNRLKPARLSILLCLLPDDFTRQWGTPGSQWVNHSLKNYVPIKDPECWSGWSFDPATSWTAVQWWTS